MLAFFVGVAVLIICAVITSERKYLIPPKEKTSVEDKKQTKQAEAKEVAATTEPEKKEFKNSDGLNILLYVGCFLVIAALMGYVSTVDEALIPPIVITVTCLALMASILIFKFVKFLKPSSYAFNVSSLIMFLFWIPSLEAIGLSWGYAFLASFLFLTGAGVISASIFKHKALWYVPAFSLIGLLTSALSIIDTEVGLNDKLMAYGCVVGFMWLGIFLRYCWKAKVTWLPIQTRHVTRTFSFVYPIISGFFTLIACESLDDYPFILTIFTVLLSFYLVLEHIIIKNKAITNILRVCLEGVCIALAIDISYGVVTMEGEAFQQNVILLTILISSFIQGLISIIMFATKHDEESHSRERWVFAASIVGLAICAMFGAATMTSSSLAIKGDMMNTVITLSAQLLTILFAAIALFLDRNPLMLIVAAIGLCDITMTNLEDSPVIACIILSVGAIIFSVSYSALRKIDEKTALPASLISAGICTLFGLGIGAEEAISYIPILGIGLSMATQGFILKNKGLRISGVYITAVGLISAWASIRTDYKIVTPSTSRYRFASTVSYPDWVYVFDAITCLIPPAAAFLLSLFDNKKTKTLKDGTETTRMTPNFIVGGVLAILNAVIVIPSLEGDLQFLFSTLSLAMLIGLLVWSAAKKWMGFEIASLIAILILVLENVGDNLWITLIIAGMGIIGIVVFISYKNYKKFNNDQATAPAPKVEAKTEQPAVEAPKVEAKTEQPTEEPKSEEKKD